MDPKKNYNNEYCTENLCRIGTIMFSFGNIMIKLRDFRIEESEEGF